MAKFFSANFRPLFSKLWWLAIFFSTFEAVSFAQNERRENSVPLRVAIESTAAPFTLVNAAGKPTGFCIDLLDAIGADQNLTFDYSVFAWTKVMEDLRRGTIDVVANIAYLRERSDFVDFTIPHAHMAGGLFIRRDDRRIATVNDLEHVHVAVAPEGVAYHYTRRHGLENNLVFINSLQESLIALNAGRVDAVLANRLVGQKLMKDLGLRNIVSSDLEISDLVYELHIGIPKGNPALLYKLNLGLYHLRENGTYDQLYERWLGPIERRDLRWRDLQPYWLPGLLLVAGLGIAFWRQRQLMRRFRRQAEALRRSEERLNLALEGSREAFWDWDISTGKVVRSPRWAEILGCPPEDIPPHIDAFNPWVHPDDVERVKTSKAAMLESHGRAEYRLQARDGSWRWIFDRGAVVARGANGRPLRVTGVATDISERKRTEEALTRSRALLEQSQAIAEMGGWEYNLATAELYWTMECYRIHDLDTPNGEISLETAVQYFTPTAQWTLRSALDAAMREGIPFDLELEIVTAKQRLVWVRTSARAEREGTRVVRLHGTYQDISKQKKATEERQKLQLKMLEAQKLESLGVLAGGIAHDFNNLLTVILGNASLARDDAASAADALGQIEVASQRAADLCRQMLAYAGKSRFNVEVLDLNGIVVDTVQLLKLSISKNAVFEFDFSSEPLPVEADPSQIRQVIMNLVINASEALGGENGRIRVSTSSENVSKERLKEARLGQDLPPGDYVAVEVEDNGSGMTEETMARVFDPFFTTKFTGRGLGLAAVVGVVRTHRGALFLKSALGNGTTFRILFPRAKGSLRSNSQKPALPIKTAKAEGAILVVDDEPNVRRIASALLEKNGYTVALAADGYEALALALAHGGKFTAVLLDLTMPGLDGPATLKELRALNPTTPVLLMSGFSEEEARKRLPADSLIAFLAKPFTGPDLLKSLDELLRQTAPAARLPNLK